MNRAIAHTTGDAVLFLNADCFLAPDFLMHARPRLDEDGVGSVAPRLLRTESATGGADGIDAVGMVVDRRRKNGLVGHGRPADAFPARAEAFGADGACALYRREVLERCSVGGEVFDEVLGLWASDADLAWRARLLGWRCTYEPRAHARHVRTYSPSKRAQVAEAHRRLQFRNRYLMWFKNETRGGLARDLPFIAAYEIAALGHVLLRERHLLRAYAQAWRALPQMRARRRAVQERRVVRRVPFGLEPPVSG
jgi:GT2 family glycosyltransferase